MGRPVFRVNTYVIEAGDFTGTSMRLYLRYDLSVNYFVMINCSVPNTAANPDNFGVRVTEDPHGTGDLTQSSGNWLTLERADNGDGDLVGAVTVVECIAAPETAGFRLLTVDAFTLTSFAASSGTQSLGHPSNAEWSNADRIVLFGGHNGGGITSSAAVDSSDTSTYGVRWRPTGSGATSTVSWQRNALSTGYVHEADATVYVVEWGSEWGVERVNVTGTNGGNYDSSGAYNTAALSGSVDGTKAWVWWSGWVGSIRMDGYPSLLAMLGSGGSAPGSSETTVATTVGLNGRSSDTDVYVLTHDDISAEWDYIEMLSGGLVDTSTVSGPSTSEARRAAENVWFASTDGARLSDNRGAVEGSASAACRSLSWARPTANTTATSNRAAGTVDYKGWVQTVDLGGVTAVVSGFDSDSNAYGPVQGLVLRNRWHDAAVITAEQEGGAVAGPVVPGNDNSGSVYGFAYGQPDMTDALWNSGSEREIDLIVTSGGGVGGSGGFARRVAGADDYAGLNALTTLFHHHSPDPTGDWLASGIAFSSVYQRLIIARVTSSTQVTIYYIETNDSRIDTGNWQTTTLAVVNADTGASGAGTRNGVGICELADGSLLMMVPTTDGTSFQDADGYISTDGGLTWTQVHSGVLMIALGTASGWRGGWQMVSSGDYVRWIRASGLIGSDTSLSLTTLASPDRGASWVETNQIPVYGVGGSLSTLPLGGTPWAICGVGDQAGTCIAVVCDPTGDDLDVYIASGTKDWTQYTSLTITYNTSSYRGATGLATRPYATWLVRGPDWIWLYVLTSDEADGGTGRAFLDITKIDPANVTDSDGWDRWGIVCELSGGLPDWMPFHTHGVWAGDSAVLFGKLGNVGTVQSSADEPGLCLMSAGQWDTEPWCTTTNLRPLVAANWLTSTAQNGHQTMTRSWHAWGGAPDAGVLTTWTYTSAGTGARTIRADYNQHTASGATDTSYDLLNDGAVAVAERFHNGSLHFWTEVASVRNVDPVAGEHVGVRVVGDGDSYDFTIRMTDSLFVVWDNHAGAPVIQGVYTTAERIEWRISWLQFSAGNSVIEIRYREVSGGTHKSDDAWSSSGQIPLTHANTPGQRFYAGVLTAGGASGTSVFRWGEWVEMFDEKVGQNVLALTYPDDMMGCPITKGGVHVANRLSVKWGGSGAFELDTFTMKVDYTRGIENLAAGVDSPDLMWESRDLTEQGVVFQAGTTTTDPRWEVDAVVLMGTVDRTAKIQFNNTDSWTSPAEEHNLDADMVTDLMVLDGEGSAVRLGVLGSGRLPAPAEGVNYYLRAVNAGANSGKTYRVWQDPDAGNGWFQLDEEVDGDIFPVGASVVLFSDRMIYRGTAFSRYRFARVVFPDVSSVGTIITKDGSRSGGTWSGTHRLGAVLLGFWVPFTVPIDWTFTDNEQPNNTEGSTRSGVSWVHREGRSQRTITGRIVGDVNEFRRRLRRTLGKVHDYSRAPAALVLNGKDPSPDSLIYVRWQSGSQQDEAAWYRDDDGNWRTAGDTDVVCTEVI